MKQFLEEYGKAIFVLVLMAILIAFASPLGINIKTAITNQMAKLEANININEKEKEYEAVDIEKSWTETHTDSYFFEHVSSDKTNVDYNKWKSNNKDKHGTSAVSTFTIEITSETEYSFDWTVSSESTYDNLTITCNGTTIVNGVSGTKNGTQKVTLKSGMNTLKATYSKDSSSSSGDDCATITLPDVKVSVCKNKQTGEMLDHIYDKGKITKEPTCTENGEKLFICKNCGKTKTEIVKKLGHTFVGEKCNRCDYVLTAVDKVYCIYYDDGEMTISQNEIEPEVGKTVVEKGFYSSPTDCSTTMTTVRFTEAVEPKSCENWFCNCQQLINIENLENLYTNECTTMYGMFASCYSLTNLDVSNWNLSKMENMNGVFSECNSLTNLDVSKWDTSNVTNMHGMFSGCSSLISLDVSNWTTDNVKSVSEMFCYCYELTNTLDLSNWNLSNAYDDIYSLTDMFASCDKLVKVKVSQETYDIFMTSIMLGLSADQLEVVK